MNRCFLILLVIMLGVFSLANPVFAIQVEPLPSDIKKDRYRLTCDSGKVHIIVANYPEQDFQYYYQNKGYYIKYYDIGFKSLYDFAEWVCRNK